MAAGDAVIGALRIILGADAAEMEKGLKKAGDSLGAFAKRVTEVVLGVELQKKFEELGKSLIEFTTHAIHNADSLNKLSQKIGIPVEELSKLQLAAKLSDLSIEDFATSMKRLTKTMEEAKDPFNVANRAFLSLGISVKDAEGKSRPIVDVMKEIAERFSVMEDGVTKGAFALAFFGRAGTQMIPFMNQGAKGFEKAGEEASKFGLVISKDVAEKAEHFMDNLKRLGEVLNGIVTLVTSSLVGPLAKITDRLVEWAKETDLAKNAANAIIPVVLNVALAILALAEAVVAAAAHVKSYATVLSYTAAAFSALLAPVAAAKGALTAIVPEGEKTTTVFQKIREEIGELAKALKAAPTEFEGLMKEVVAQLDASAKAMGAITFKFDLITPEKLAQMKQLNDSIEKTSIKTLELDGAFRSLAPGFVQAALGMGKLGEEALATFMKTGQLKGQFAELNQELLNFKAAQLTEENLLPYDRYGVKLEELRGHLQAGRIDFDTFSRANFNLQERLGISALQLEAQYANMAGSLSQLTRTYAKENKAMGIASKAFGIAQTIINTQIAITKALATFGPTPLGYAGVAAAVASGAAAIAAITAQTFAMGGTFRVGGAGALDSKLLQMRLSPGEMVDVRKGQYGESVTGGGSYSEPREVQITLQGSSFHVTDIRDFFDKLNQGIRDGYRIVPAAG